METIKRKIQKFIDTLNKKDNRFQFELFVVDKKLTVFSKLVPVIEIDFKQRLRGNRKELKLVTKQNIENIKQHILTVYNCFNEEGK